MSSDLSKLCADFLRQDHASRSPEKLKASHAREIVAAFFGYKSHAALMAETTYPLDRLEEAYVFVPDIPLIEERKVKLNGLPSDMISSFDTAKLLSEFLTEEGLCGAEIWLYDTLESYLAEVFLPDSQGMIDDDLAGVMAETNAGFYDDPYYGDVAIEDRGSELVAVTTAEYKGEQVDGKMFSGDTIDMMVTITFPRMAGKRGFYQPEVATGGSVDNDWRD